MSKQVKFSNVKVSFSSMMNAESKCPYGRLFRVLVPMDSPELAQLKEQYLELNDKSKNQLSEQLGKKLKNAVSVEDKFQESTHEGEEGYCVLTFNVVRLREKEVINEDGTKTKTKEFVTDSLYKDGFNCYKLDNNGNKIYETESGKKFLPLSTNIIDITVSLVAKYNSKENKPSIQLRADEVKIVHSEFGNRTSKPEFATITLEDEDEEREVIQNKVEKSSVKKDEELFSEDEIADLDLASV